jgi:DNA-binding CsgD family transcriptional regulator
MMEVDGLTKRYGDKTAVDGLSFVVEPGVVTGFLGPNGAGKSTTMRMIAGLDRPTSGTVRVNGKHYPGAAALLGRPQAVVLDEPVNGLDPDGVRWIRLLLKSLAAEGQTVFVSGREQEVFSHIATGQSNSEIAATLFLSEGTVKIHVGRILAKLGLRDRVQAVVLAYESRLIRPAPAVISAVIRTACRGGADDRPEPRPARCGGRPGPRSTFRSIPRAPRRAP